MVPHMDKYIYLSIYLSIYIKNRTLISLQVILQYLPNFRRLKHECIYITYINIYYLHYYINLNSLSCVLWVATNQFDYAPCLFDYAHSLVHWEEEFVTVHYILMCISYCGAISILVITCRAHYLTFWLYIYITFMLLV